MKGLARATRQGISWTLLNSVAATIIRFGVIAVLSRLLEPGDFGVVAAAMTVIQFGNTLRDLGVGVALVQRKELEPEHVEAAFTFSVGLGLALGTVIFFSAGLIGQFFRMQQSVPLVRMLSVLFVLRGVSLVPQFTCRREMRFRALAIVDFVAYAAGAALSIGLAFGGVGAWSIAWGYVLETGISVFALLAIAGAPKRLRFRGAHLRDLLGFGLGQSAANLANYFANQGDYMVVGHVLDATQLGFYQRAYELVRAPATVFSNVAGSVLFSAFAKVQDDPERIGRAFLRTMFTCAIVLLPVSAGLIVLAPEVVRIVLGPHWANAIWPFRIMCVTMLFRTTYKVGALVGRSSGEVFKIAGWQMLYAVSVIGGAAFSVRWGIMGVATTTAISIAVVFVGLSSIGLRMSKVTVADLLGAHFPALSCAALVGGSAWLIATGLRALDQRYYVVAGISTLGGSLVYLAFVMVQIRRGRGYWPWLVETAQKFIAVRRKRKTDPNLS